MKGLCTKEDFASSDIRYFAMDFLLILLISHRLF